MRTIVVEQSALGTDDRDDARLAALLTRHEQPPTLLLSRASTAPPAGTWSKTLRRPFSVDDVVRAVQALLPLSPVLRHPVD